MKYYKYLDLDWQTVATKLKDYIHNEKPILLKRAQYGNWQDANTRDIMEKIPEIKEMLKPLGATVRYIAFFISGPVYGGGAIHVDMETETSPSSCRINIPVQHCENSETRFFRSLAPAKVGYQAGGAPFQYFDPATCEQVDAFHLDRGPVLFRNTEPHQVVVADKSLSRISCTIALNEDLVHLLND